MKSCGGSTGEDDCSEKCGIESDHNTETEVEG